MSSLDSGFYGFNTLNVNGETSQLPLARLFNTQSQSHGGSTNAVYFNEGIDEYGMLIPNQSSAAGTFSAVRIPISGLYVLETSLSIIGNTGAGNVDVYFSLDKAGNFTSSGVYVPVSAAFFRRYTTANGLIITAANSVKVFLEKDTYVSVYTSGVNSALYADTSPYFSVQCLSAENLGKPSCQP